MLGLQVTVCQLCGLFCALCCMEVAYDLMMLLLHTWYLPNNKYAKSQLWYFVVWRLSLFALCTETLHEIREKIWRKGTVGISRDCPKFLSTPYYPRNGKATIFKIWQVHSQGQSEQKPMKNSGEKGACASPETAHFFEVPPIISRMGKATNFIFGRYIQGRPNKSPLNIWEKRKRGRIQIFWVGPTPHYFRNG